MVKDYDDDATCLTTAVAIVVVAFVTLLVDSTNLAADTKAVSNATDGKRLISPPPSLFSPFGALLSFYSKWGEGGREQEEEEEEDQTSRALFSQSPPILRFLPKTKNKQLIYLKKR